MLLQMHTLILDNMLTLIFFLLSPFSPSQHTMDYLTQTLQQHKDNIILATSALLGTFVASKLLGKLLRRAAVGKLHKPQVCPGRLNRSTVIITGANAGLGEETVF